MKGDEEQAEKRWQRYISLYLPVSPRRRGGSAPRERRLREAPLLEVARLLHTQWGTRVAGAAGAPGESSRGREAWGGAGRRGEARGGVGRRGEARGRSFVRGATMRGCLRRSSYTVVVPHFISPVHS